MVPKGNEICVVLSGTRPPSGVGSAGLACGRKGVLSIR